jgi:hypothetical protein
MVKPEAARIGCSGKSSSGTENGGCPFIGSVPRRGYNLARCA